VRIFSDGLLYFGVKSIIFLINGKGKKIKEAKNSLLQNLALTLAYEFTIFSTENKIFHEGMTV